MSNDHREVAQRLDLLHFQEEAPGMAFWHPRGLILYRLLEDAARRELAALDYREVQTPQLLRRPIWEASGHWQHFQAGMFQVDDGPARAAIKPVSCPGHIQIVKSRGAPSYRELPIRLAEFGVVHRDEPSGTLQGLLRLRQFTQDDGHVFCRPEQAEDEVERFCRSVAPFYARFGFEGLSVALSTRPSERAGDDASWDWAEGVLASVARRLGMPVAPQPGEGAFYGPKLEFVLRDRQGRSWQCGTVQIDPNMPRRFDLRYVDASGARLHPVMIHRALYGSLERFLAVLLEQHGPALPRWLAPEQIRVLPVVASAGAWAERVAARLRGASLRVELDARDEPLARRVAQGHEDAVPFLAIVGAREAASGDVTIREGGEQRSIPLEEAAAYLAERCEAP